MRRQLLLPGLVLGLSLAGLALVPAADEPSHGGKTLTEWSQALKEDDPSLRWQAAEALGQMGRSDPRRVVPALRRAVRDNDLDVRLQAVASLTGLGPRAEGAVPELQGVLRDRDSDLRRQAATALAAVGPLAEEASATLGQVLKDPNANVRLAAVNALQVIGPEAHLATAALAMAIKDKVPSVRRAAATALSRVAPAAAPDNLRTAITALSAGLKDGDPEVRRRCAGALGILGPRAAPAVAALAEASRSGEDALRAEAALALIRIGAAALPALTENLKHDNVQVRARAAEGLRSLGVRARPAFKLLAQALTDKDAAVRYAAMGTLPILDPEPAETLSLLLPAVTAEDASVRAWAVRWLGAIAAEDRSTPEKAIAALAKALEDRAAIVRAAAADALRPLGPTAKASAKTLLGLVKDPDATVRLKAALALGKIDPEGARSAVPTLIAALSTRGTARKYDPNPFNRPAAQALAAIGAVEPLVEALQSKDDGIRAGATFTLALMGARARAAFKGLTAALQNKDALVRQRSAEALQAISPDPKEAVPMLTESLRHEDDYLRQWAAGFLAALGPRADTEPAVALALAPLAAAATRDATSQVRQQATRALGAIASHLPRIDRIIPASDEATVEALVSRLTDANAGVRAEAVRALGELGAARKGQGPVRKAVPGLLAYLTRGHPFEGSAANALGQIGIVPALAEAVAKAEQEKVRAGSAAALGVIGPRAREAAAVLNKALKDKDCYVRERSALALAAIGRAGAAAVPALVEALKDPDVVVPPAAARALLAMGAQAGDAAAALGTAMRTGPAALAGMAQLALVAIGPESVPTLAKILEADSPDAVIRAAGALRQIGPRARPALPALKKAFARAADAPVVRGELALTLTALGANGKEDVPALAIALTSRNRELSRKAVTALHALGADAVGAVPELAGSLSDRNYTRIPIDVKRLAARTLARIGARDKAALAALPALVDALDAGQIPAEVAVALYAILGAARANLDPFIESMLASDRGGLNERQVAVVLGAIPPDNGDARAALLKLLGHRNARVRAAAATALSAAHYTDRKEPRQALLRRLDDDSALVRLSAIQALTHVFKPDTAAQTDQVSALGEQTKHWDEATRRQAAVSLVDVLVKQPDASIEKALRTRMVALSAVVLLDMVRTESDGQQEQAVADALTDSAYRPALVPALIRALTDADAAVRQRAAAVLRGLRQPADDRTVQSAVRALAGVLADRHPGLRQQAATSLGLIGRRAAAATDALEKAMADRNRAVQVAAALALWQVNPEKSKAALPVLIDELGAGTISPGTIAALRQGPLTAPVLTTLVAMGPAAVPALIEAARNKDARVRAGAIAVLGSMKKLPAEAVPPLAQALADDDPGVRSQAAEALTHPDLARLPAPVAQALPALTKALDDPGSGVRREAARALGKLGPQGAAAVPELGELLEDADAGVRVGAVEALGQIGVKAKEALLGLRLALLDASADVRAAAIHTLEKLGAAGVKEALPPLQMASKDRDEDLRAAAQESLRKLGVKDE